MDLTKPINWKRTIEINGEYGCMGDLGIHTQHVPFRMGWIPKNVYAVLSDICKEDYRKNARTFAGYYAAIVQRLKDIAPDAKFFFMTMPEENNRAEIQLLKNAHAKLMYDFAEFFDNSYVLDFKKYAPVYNEAFKQKFYLNNHLNAAGYALTAKFVISYIDYIIRHNIEDFSEIALVNTPYKNYKSK
jgi:hypothetical protein